MRLQNPFAVLAPSGIDSQVLTVLARVEQFLSVHQIQQLLPERGSLQGVRNSVERLLEQGTVRERVAGRSRAYGINREHLLADAIGSISRAKQEFLARLRDAVAAWPLRPLSVVMFGSAARNEMRSDSDIDLLFVFPDDAPDDLSHELVHQLVARAAAWTGNDVRPLVYSDREIEPASIFESILRDGVEIAGEPSWLRRRLREGVRA